MPGSPWSRSRFWLCHFLHNRHVRLRIETPQHPAGPEQEDFPILAWLQRFAARAQRMPTWLIDAALTSHADDPAFVQCLRLWIKEEQYLARLAGHLAIHHLTTASDCCSQAEPSMWIALLLRMRRQLGIRCEVSILLLGHLLELVSLRHLHFHVQDPALRLGLEQLFKDRQKHVAFASEWLTSEFADFHFFRRNLRRLRLRLLFALLLVNCLRQIRASELVPGGSRGQLLREAWSSFNRLLEYMVPYRRDVLLQQLLSQREYPYDQPARIPK